MKVADVANVATLFTLSLSLEKKSVCVERDIHQGPTLENYTAGHAHGART